MHQLQTQPSHRLTVAPSGKILRPADVLPIGRLAMSSEWRAYFRLNAESLPPIPWMLGADAGFDELRPIIPSLRAWQLGETSDGRHLLKAAARYARSVGDADFVDAVRLFIREEQRHGANLGRFLDLAGVERKQLDWGDSLFRCARYWLGSMEAWVTPVVMVETHAMIYYSAIRRATRSRVLRGICRQILIDEVPHLRFQCERLAILHRRRGPLLMALTRLGHRFLFTAITLAIWTGHRRAYRAGGRSFGAFWTSAWRHMERAWRMMNPTLYGK